MMTCPHCNKPLTPEQLESLWGKYRESKRKNRVGGLKTMTKEQRSANGKKAWETRRANQKKKKPPE